MAQNVRHSIGKCITVIGEDFVISKLYVIILCTSDYAVNRKKREQLEQEKMPTDNSQKT